MCCSRFFRRAFILQTPVSGGKGKPTRAKNKMCAYFADAGIRGHRATPRFSSLHAEPSKSLRLNSEGTYKVIVADLFARAGGVLIVWYCKWL